MDDSISRKRADLWVKIDDVIQQIVSWDFVEEDAKSYRDKLLERKCEQVGITHDELPTCELGDLERIYEALRKGLEERDRL